MVGQWSEIYLYLFSPNQTLPVNQMPVCSPLGKVAVFRRSGRAQSKLSLSSHVFMDSDIVYMHSFSDFQRENRSGQLLSVIVSVEFK